MIVSMMARIRSRISSWNLPSTFDQLLLSLSIGLNGKIAGGEAA